MCEICNITLQASTWVSHNLDHIDKMEQSEENNIYRYENEGEEDWYQQMKLKVTQLKTIMN